MKLHLRQNKSDFELLDVNKKYTKFNSSSHFISQLEGQGVKH